jgi:hypothetical protein
MSQLLLCFGLDSATGQPRLTVRKGQLAPEELKRLDAELRRNYRQLTELDGKVVQVRSKLGPLPAGAAAFKVRVNRRVQRCPTLWLHSVPSTAPVTASTAPLEPKPTPSKPKRDRADWVAGFRKAAHEALAAVRLRDPEADAVLTPVLSADSTLWKTPPHRLALRLLAGLLEDRASEAESNSDSAACLTRAAECVRRCLEPAAPDRPEADRPGWLKRAWCWLKRLLPVRRPWRSYFPVSPRNSASRN